MKSPLPVAVAVGAGLLVLAGTFFPFAPLATIRSTLLNWAAALAGLAGVIAIANLMGVHWRKISISRGREGYSWVVLLAFFATLIPGLLYGPSHPAFQSIMNNIQIPIEASLMGLVAISLTFAGVRLFQRRRGLLAVVFFFSALFFLMLASGLLAMIPNMGGLSQVLSLAESLPVAGSRGILIGVALGSLVAGVRVLIGAQRPYEGQS